MSMGGLVARLGLDRSGFSSGLHGAGGDMAAFASRIRSQALGLAGALGAGFGIASILEQSEAAEQASKKLDSVLRSTGNATGFSADQLREYAAELQQLTNFEDDATVSAMAVLATFKQVGGQTFKDATAVAQDMSSVLGGDLQSNLILVGRALNDPIAGLTRLKKRGIEFTEQQVAQIKALQESGNLLGAQAIILGELQSKYGGAAQAMASPTKQLRNVLGDLAETMGLALLPAAKEIATALMNALGPTGELASKFRMMGSVLVGVVRFIADYGRGLMAAVAFMVVYKGALMAIAAAQKSMAIGAAIVQALQGPKGWVQLAAGVAAAGIAVGILTDRFDALAAEVPEVSNSVVPLVSNLEDMGDAAEEAGAPLDKLFERARKLKEELQGSSLDKQLEEIRVLKELGGISGSEAAGLGADARDKASGSKNKIKELREEVQKLNGTLTDGEIAFRRMMEAGARPEQAQGVKDLTEQVKAIEEQKKAAKEAEDKAEKARNQQREFRQSVLEDVRTPIEKYAARVRELQRAFSEGVLSPGLFKRAVEKARAELGGDQKQREASKLEGAEVSSREALAGLIAFNKQGEADNDAAKKTAENTAQSNRLLREIDRKLDRQLREIESEQVYQIPG